eukprot:3514621-Ditylum_brightwellii.AAC.1
MLPPSTTRESYTKVSRTNLLALHHRKNNSPPHKNKGIIYFDHNHLDSTFSTNKLPAIRHYITLYPVISTRDI